MDAELKFVSKAGAVRTSLGRPKISPKIDRRVRAELAKGTGIITTAKRLGLDNGTVHRDPQGNGGVVMAPIS